MVIVVSFVFKLLRKSNDYSMEVVKNDSVV